MAKNEQTQTEAEPMLIDILPEQAKKVLPVAREYKELQRARMNVLDKEVAKKQELLVIVKKLQLKPLEGGVIRFKLDGVTISITPRDELIKVKEDSAE